MDAKLYKDWNEEKGLFRHSVIYSEMEYAHDIQLRVLQLIWDYLKENVSSNESLYFLSDRFQNTGQISDKRTIDKKELEALLTDPTQVLSTKDFCVYDLVYGETFLLRWYNQKEDENEIFCDFAFILSDELALKKVHQTMATNIFSEGLKIKNAKQYFDDLCIKKGK